MAVATIGIAMGAADTDTAVQTADTTLMKDDLNKLAEAVHLGVGASTRRLQIRGASVLDGFPNLPGDAPKFPPTRSLTAKTAVAH
jgi:Cd2+/Zn2+-exporting ATPase